MEELCARITKDNSCSMGSRVLWPKVPPAPAKAFEKKGVGRLSCVEAALWVEERWQSATGTAGATTCACDAAGNMFLVVVDTSSTFFLFIMLQERYSFSLLTCFACPCLFKSTFTLSSTSTLLCALMSLRLQVCSSEQRFALHCTDSFLQR